MCCSTSRESICPRMLEVLQVYRGKYLSQNVQGAVSSIRESIYPRIIRLEVLSALSEKVFIQNARGAVVLSEKVFIPECSRYCSSIGESIYPRMFNVL